MKRINSIPALVISFFLFVFLSCTQSDEQREFEREAISLPENITETNANGEIVEGRTDPDDWRIAPFFQGLIDVFPASPNPVLTSDHVRIEVLVHGFDSINGLKILVFYRQNRYKILHEALRSPLPPGTTSFSIQAVQIPQFGENPTGIYRLILEDFEGNIISYGDVKIE